MSPGTALAVSLSVTAGLAGSVQAAVMGKLGDRIGIVEAIAFSTVVSFSVGLSVLLVVRQNVGGVGSAVRQPVWLWTGRLLSVFIILAITVGPPRIGVTATIGLVIAGNLAMASFIDRFGWLAAEKTPLAWPRILGIVLLAVGAALTLRR